LITINFSPDLNGTMKTIFEQDPEFQCDIGAPCFTKLNLQETNLVQASRTQVIFRKGDNLTKQGAYASYVLFMGEGIARQYIEGDHDKSFNLKIIQPGEFVGLSTVFEKNTFPYSAVALTECRAFLVERDTIAQVVRLNGDFALSLIRRYFEQNEATTELLRRVIYKQMNGRMANTLLYLDSIKGAHPEIFSLLSRKDLAEFAGTSTENAVKLLKSFESDGLIRLDDKDISVLDHHRLHEISQRG